MGCVQGMEMLDWVNTRSVGWCRLWFLEEPLSGTP